MNSKEQHVRSLTTITEEQLQVKVEGILKDIGVPFGRRNYLKEAVIKVYQDKSYLNKGMTMRLYPEIAQKYNTTKANVERQIGRAIATAFEFGDVELQIEIFKKEYIYKTDKPTNKYAIECLVEYLKKNL